MRTEIRIRRRILTMLLSLVVLFLLISVRIGRLTMVEGAALTARGVRQWTREGVVTAKRGSIVDCHGEVLTTSATAYIVTANPQLVTDEEAFCDVLCGVLSADRDAMLRRISNKSYASVTLKRQVPRETVDEIRALRLKSAEMKALLRGIAFDEDAVRWYPKGAFLTQALGLTNIDAVGQSGLELRYEDALKGVPGSLKTEVDARARLLPDGETVYVAPEEGNTLKLTIDATIQGVVERAMRECLLVNNAVSVQCIVMDARTGAIRALCMKPDYDPNDPPRDNLSLLNELMRTTIVTDVYEPGSTFKILTCAAALDSGSVTLDSAFHCAGSVTVEGDRIRCWKNSHGAQDLTDAIANSCNPAFVSIALKMGDETFYRYLRAFGLGRRTGVDLPGESAGILIGEKYVKTVDLARIGFGQSVAVTPIQLLSAVCAVVNGGRLMKPYIVDSVLSREGETLEKTAPAVLAQPIGEETSRTMRALLENVVENGGGKNGAVDGYRVGGKTGTAQVYKDGRIVSNVHIGSFIGFAPADEPEIALLITVNEANVPVDYGSATAAPFARQIMEEVLPYLGVRRDDGEQREMLAVPDVTGMTLAQARKTLGEAGFLTDTDGLSDTVSAQAPLGGAKLPRGGEIMLYTYEGEPARAAEYVSVPDVAGLSVVEAARALRARGLYMTMEGSGLAAAQSPAAGAYVPPESEVLVTFALP